MKSFRAIAVVALLGASAVAFAEGPGIEGEIEQSSTTTPEEKTAFAQKSIEEIGAAVQTVEKLLDAAKKANQKDAVECLERKLTPLKAIAEVGKQAGAAMTRAIAENDTVHSEGEFRKLAVAVSKAKDFLAEAQQCVASSKALPGTTVTAVSSSQDNLIDVDDQDEGVLIEPPVSPG